MPQEQLYRYDIEYNGYRFSVDAYNQPTEDEIRRIWVDSVANKIDTNQSIPGLDIGSVESDYDRAERNSNDIGSMEPDRAYRDATFWQRFWDSAKLSAIPHFGTMESQYTPADESSELWAEALGGVSIITLYFFPVFISVTSSPVFKLIFLCLFSALAILKYPGFSGT